MLIPVKKSMIIYKLWTIRKLLLLFIHKKRGSCYAIKIERQELSLKKKEKKEKYIHTYTSKILTLYNIKIYTVSLCPMYKLIVDNT